MTSPTCPECGAPYTDGTKTCPECGMSLEPADICPDCGAPLPPGSAVCPDCGAPSGGRSPTQVVSVAPSAPSTPVAPVMPRVASGAYPNTLPNGVIASGRSHNGANGFLGLLTFLNIVSVINFIAATAKLTDKINEITQTVSAVLAETESVLKSIVDKINSIPMINIPFNIDLNGMLSQAVSEEDMAIAKCLGVFSVVSFVLIPAILIFAYVDLSRGYRITVTRDHVKGKRPFSGSVKLPINCITDVKTDITGNIAVCCSGKRYVFKEIDNNDGVFRAIRDLTAGNGLLRK